jgi:hypothetical protein
MRLVGNAMTDGDDGFIVGGAVLLIRRNGADEPLKVSNAIISSVSRAGYAYLRGADKSGFKLTQGCSAAWEQTCAGAPHGRAWIVPDTPANRRLYADAIKPTERTRPLKSRAAERRLRDEGAAESA